LGQLALAWTLTFRLLNAVAVEAIAGCATTGAKRFVLITRFVDYAEEHVGAGQRHELVLKTMFPMNQVRQHPFNAHVELVVALHGILKEVVTHAFRD